MYDVPLTRNLQAWTLLPTDIFPLHYPLRITVFLSFLIESGYLNLLASVLLLLLIINETRHWAKKEKRYFLLNFFHDGIKHGTTRYLYSTRGDNSKEPSHPIFGIPREARSKQGTTRGGRSIRFFSDARLEGRGEKWGTVDGGEGGGGKRSTPVTPRSYDASLIPEMLAHTL